MGGIDRLGSPNDNVLGINFWPSNNIKSYLDLQGRIEQRMAAMKLAGSEVNLDFSDTFKEMAEDKNLENRLNAKMMQQMQTSWDDIEDNNEGLGFDDLSLESYRQDLLEEFNKNKDKFIKMPKGVYSGFKADRSICPENGIIALLGYPCRKAKNRDHEYKHFDLIYIDFKGKMVLLNQKDVLDAVTLHKDYDRFVPDAIDRGEATDIAILSSAIQTYLNDQAKETIELEDGSTKTVMGKEARDVLDKLRRGEKSALERIKENTTTDEKYQIDNFDLITWFIVST